MKNLEKLIHKNVSKEGLKLEFFKCKKENEGFREYLDTIPLSDNELMKYTHKLLDSFKENNNCKNCKGLDFCKNEVKGCKYSWFIVENNLNFSHKICKYKTKLLDDIEYVKNGYLFEVAKDVRNAKIKDIYTNDKNRVETIKWVTTFIKEYKQRKAWKGLYLSGSFGSGKSYILSATINELIKDGYKGALIYYPEFLRSLKASFGKDFDEMFNYAKKSDLLLLDDIGAESLTNWSRDEILGPLLQYRMDEKLPTFFSSNLNIKELEVHLSLGKGEIDKVKAKRIIERIKYMTDNVELISENKRK